MALPEQNAIHVEGLGRRFGLRWILRGVTFGVERGEVVGLLGANGSGKSTVLRVLATLLRPNAGRAAVNGFDVLRSADDVRSSVGYLAHVAGLYDDLTAQENLRFAADMLGVSHAHADSALARVGLKAVGGERVRGFSAGMQRRLALARLLLHRPRVLLLDEPYSNLDTDGVGLVNSVISGIVADGGAALIVLHEQAPAARILTRTVTLTGGRIAATAGNGVASPSATRSAATR
jgi:heme ABC exporter ATP-binding subunit CcmA